MKNKGRPSSYTSVVGDDICKRIAEGESLRAICSEEGMPDQTTVYRWIKDNEAFRQQYARAREDQAEHYLDDIIQIADDCTDDVIFLTVDDDSGEGGRAVIKHSAIARARVQIDTRKWAMSKLAPKKYGDKVLNEHSGLDGAPIQTAAIDLSKYTSDELKTLRTILAKGNGGVPV